MTDNPEGYTARRERATIRVVIVTIALLGIAGAVRAEGALQTEPLIVFQRICNIEPGQDATAEALAREMVSLVEGKYPGAEMSVSTGRWMTGFQNIEQPVDQMLFRERHPDAAMRQDFTDILSGDEEFRALQRTMLGVIDLGSCTESQFRAPSP